MLYNSYLNPGSVRKTCQDYILYLQKENSVYEQLKTNVNNFIWDNSSEGEAIKVLKDRMACYSAAIGSLIMANNLDIQYSKSLMDNVGDEVLDGSVIIPQKEDAKSDHDDYRGTARDCYRKAYEATSLDTKGYWEGEGHRYDGMADGAWERYEFYCDKEKNYDDINGNTSGVFEGTNDLRNKAKDLINALSSGDDKAISIAKESLKQAYAENNVDYVENSFNSSDSGDIIWDVPEDRPIDKSTYTGKAIAELYEQKAALEKAMENDPSQRNYFLAQIAMLEDNIKSWTEYGFRNTEHGEEFDFVYNQLLENGYTDEEKISIFTYWMAADQAEILGKEMPEWWMKEHLAFHNELKINEENVLTAYEDNDFKQALEDYYFSSYFLIDCISGRPWQEYNGSIISEEEIDSDYYDSSVFRKLFKDYQTEKENNIDSLIGQGLTYDWFDSMYGQMKDYVSGVGSVRASKYALEKYMGFKNIHNEYGVYNYFDEFANDYYKFCKSAYLTKYDHAKDFYENIWTSDNQEEKIIKYINEDLANGIRKYFTYEENEFLQKNYEAYKNGELIYSRNLYDVAYLLEKDQTVFSYGQYETIVEGKRVQINAEIINDMSFAGNTHSDSYTMDFSDSATYVFGSYYIANEDFVRKSIEFSTYRYDHGWIDPLSDAEREQEDEVIREQAALMGITIDENDEEGMAQLRRFSKIMADSNALVQSAFIEDRATASDQFNDEWDQYMFALGVCCSLMFLVTPVGWAEAATLVLGLVNGSKQIAQGDYIEGGTEIALSLAGTAATVVNEVSETKHLKDMMKGAGDIIDDADFVVDSANKWDDLEMIKTNFISYDKLNEMKGQNIERVFYNLEQKEIIDMVENSPGGIKSLNNFQKGNYGEMKMDVFFESKGYKRVNKKNRLLDLNEPMKHGIDGVYYNPKGHPPYIICDSKFGTSKLGITSSGPQMSDMWIKDKRLEKHVGEKIMNNIIKEGYERILFHVSQDGSTNFSFLNEIGEIIKK